MIVPTNVVEVAIVAELVTRQKMSQGCAPPIRWTREPDAVINVVGAAVVPIWKM
jgi:hypothetical protein